MSRAKIGIIILTTNNYSIDVTAKIGIQTIISSAIALTLGYYQKYFSPDKGYQGFSCAYCQLHQAESCSTYFKNAIANNDSATAIPLFQQRLLNSTVAQ